MHRVVVARYGRKQQNVRFRHGFGVFGALTNGEIDLAPLVGASLEVMARDAKTMRGERPFLFSNLKTGQGLADIIALIEEKGMLNLDPEASHA